MKGLPTWIRTRLQTADLGLDECSTRDDVRRVRAQLPTVHGIGSVALWTIDRWLTDDTAPGDGTDGAERRFAHGNESSYAPGASPPEAAAATRRCG